MGVHGLWKLIEPSGKVVPLDTLEGKVLAIDVSIWLHQAIKGFQDSKGAPIPNAHLLTLYHRVCKLLYFHIKPIFVFDGGVPALKKDTIARRNELKSKNLNDANSIQKQLINTLLKYSAVNKVLSESCRPALESQAKKATKSSKVQNPEEDMFILPPSQTTYESTDSESECGCDTGTTATPESSPTKYFNIHDIDEKSTQFRSLPADVRHEILSDLKETRKQNSWGRIHELPKQSDDFATYQMKRLLKRYSIQTCLEAAEKEMGGASLSLHELESLLNDHGVITENKGARLASDENTRYLYVKDVKKQLEKAKLQEIQQTQIELDEKCDETTEKDPIEQNVMPGTSNNGMSEFDEDLKAAIQLSLTKHSTGSKTDNNTDKNTCKSDNTAEIVQTVDSHDSKNKTIADSEFERDLEAAIQLSLTEHSTVSKSENTSDNNTCSQLVGSSATQNSEESIPIVTSDSDTTPISSQEITSSGTEFGSQLPSYLNSLRDSDFQSSDEDELHDKEVRELQQNKSGDVFSAARNYMREYGGLTQAGVEHVFGEAQTTIKTSTIKSINKTHLITSNTNAKDVIIESNATSGANSSSDSNSSDEFVDVSDEECVVLSDTNESKKNEMQITINTKDALVDDIFGDIFDSKTDIVATQKKDDSNPKETSVKSISTDCDKPIVEGSNKIAEPGPNLLQELMAQAPSSSTLGNEDLQKMKTALTQNSDDLLMARGTKERLGTSISDQMYQEAQDLLRIFGIPFIVAPMEAEAQCAFLNEINLTDGTITDDSDIWLFGGHTVYKNFFNHEKQVLEFKSDSIQRYFKLSRDKLIALALLVGSDYTTGIQGIGPVTALEVLAAFPPKSKTEIISTLEEFSKWFTSGKKVSGRGKALLRNKLKNVELHEGFPSANVVKAYLEPTVETSREAFTWGKPNLQVLVGYAREKFGWTEKKAVDLLEPVFKRMNATKGQKRIHDYFKTSQKPSLNTSLEVVQSKLSKRVKKALDSIGGVSAEIMTSSSSDENAMDEDAKVLKQTKKLSKARSKNIRHEVEVQLKRIEKKADAKSDQSGIEVKKPTLSRLNRKEVIPQREIAKSNQMQNRLKAIEVFRKSTKGPGYLKKRVKVHQKPLEDANLSESSNSDN